MTQSEQTLLLNILEYVVLEISQPPAQRIYERQSAVTAALMLEDYIKAMHSPNAVVLEALDSMVDYAMMDCKIEPIGAEGVLRRFITGSDEPEVITLSKRDSESFAMSLMDPPPVATPMIRAMAQTDHPNTMAVLHEKLIKELKTLESDPMDDWDQGYVSGVRAAKSKLDKIFNDLKK